MFSRTTTRLFSSRRCMADRERPGLQATTCEGQVHKIQGLSLADYSVGVSYVGEANKAVVQLYAIDSLRARLGDFLKGCILLCQLYIHGKVNIATKWVAVVDTRPRTAT